MYTISTHVVNFLSAISKNNSREWFNMHKQFYQQARQDFEAFVATIISEVTVFYPLGSLSPQDCIYRQQRDVRFSKDKTPYTSHMSALIAPEGKKTSYIPLYLRIKPDGTSVLGAGIWSCTSQQLYQVRQEIDYNPAPIHQLMARADFQKYFGALKGECLRRPPKGYNPDHADIQLLKQKQFYIEHIITSTQYLAPDFADHTITIFKAAMPLVNYLNQALDVKID